MTFCRLFPFHVIVLKEFWWQYGAPIRRLIWITLPTNYPYDTRFWISVTIFEIYFLKIIRVDSQRFGPGYHIWKIRLRLKGGGSLVGNIDLFSLCSVCDGRKLKLFHRSLLPKIVNLSNRLPLLQHVGFRTDDLMVTDTHVELSALYLRFETCIVICIYAL